MKKIIIIGASGSLAEYVIQALSLMTDVALTLFLRDRKRLPKKATGNAVIMEGDAMNSLDIARAVKGQDIVYINLAGNLKTMGKNIVQAMQENGVKRVIAISSIGIYQTPLKPVLIPYRKLAEVIEASGLDYTILRPDWFTSADEVNYILTKKGEPETGSAISRKSIATFVATLIDNPDLHKNENLGISNPN
jgi:uncharacterized protein YbjT (DUF2867 family)